MADKNKKKQQRLERRKWSIRSRVFGSSERPRLSVFRSDKHIYAQLIDDVSGTTVAAASSQKLELAEGARGSNRDGAKAVGKALAEAAVAKNVKRVVFDRNGYLYHGRVAALADAAREAGLQF